MTTEELPENRGSGVRKWVGVLILLVIVLVGMTMLAPGLMLEKRLKQGEITEADVEAFQANPLGWTNMLGDLMIEAAEARNIELFATLANFMLGALNDLDEGGRRTHELAATWVFSAALAALEHDQDRFLVFDQVEAGGGVSLGALCSAAAGYPEGVGGYTISRLVLRNIAVALTELPDLQERAVALCSDQMFASNISAHQESFSERLDEDFVGFAVDLFTVFGIGRVDEAIGAEGVTPRMLAHMSAAASSLITELPEDSSLAQELTTWRSGGLNAAVIRILMAPTTSDEDLWQGVDPADTPAATVLVEILVEFVPPLGVYAITERLFASAPEENRVALEEIRQTHHELATNTLNEVVRPILEGCPATVSLPDQPATHLDVGVIPVEPYWVVTGVSETQAACLLERLAELPAPGRQWLSHAFEFTP